MCSMDITATLELLLSVYLYPIDVYYILAFQVEQTLDVEYYWLFDKIRHQLQKRTKSSKVSPADHDYDDLRARAVIEREMQQQVRCLNFVIQINENS